MPPSKKSITPSRTLTREGILQAVAALERRLQEVKDLDPKAMTKWEQPKIDAINFRIEDTIARLFGAGTEEFQRFYRPVVNSNAVGWGYETPEYEITAGWQEGIDSVVEQLQSSIQMLRERLNEK